MHKIRQNPSWLLVIVVVLFVACGTASENDGNASQPETEPTDTALPAPTDTAVPPTNTPQPDPTDTAVPATDTPDPEPTATSEPTATLEPTAEPTATPLVDPDPLFEIGASANWTDTNDLLGIEGEIEYTSATEIVIRDFVFLAAEAPGVDIRLGVDDDFSDEVAVSLKDITGRTYEGRSLTLTIPPEGFDGRSFNSIGVFCFDTGDLFDWAPIEAP